MTPDPPARCERPPRGWVCSRPPGHDGPCAATPDPAFQPDRRAGRRRWDRVRSVLAWSAPATLLASGIVGWVAIGGAHKANLAADAARQNARQIASKEVEQLDLVHRAAWRLCEREMRDRALLHAALIATPPGGESAAREEARRLFRFLVEKQNPIVDCAPNLDGDAATALSVGQQRAYVRRWQAGQLEPLPEPPGAPSGLRLDPRLRVGPPY